MSSDSILVVLGIVSPVESAFGGCLLFLLSVHRCDFKLVHHCAVSISWLCFRSPDLAIITVNWSHCCFDHAGPWCGLFYYFPMDPWLRPVSGAGFEVHFSPFCELSKCLQWGTKVLTHFRKMAPFCTVDILIPFPCLPQPLSPKINVEFWTLKSFFYFRQHWFGGWGDLQHLKGME